MSSRQLIPAYVTHAAVFPVARDRCACRPSASGSVLRRHFLSATANSSSMTPQCVTAPSLHAASPLLRCLVPMLAHYLTMRGQSQDQQLAKRAVPQARVSPLSNEYPPPQEVRTGLPCSAGRCAARHLPVLSLLLFPCSTWWHSSCPAFVSRPHELCVPGARSPA